MFIARSKQCQQILDCTDAGIASVLWLRIVPKSLRPENMYKLALDYLAEPSHILGYIDQEEVCLTHIRDQPRGCVELGTFDFLFMSSPDCVESGARRCEV